MPSTVALAVAVILAAGLVPAAHAAQTASPAMPARDVRQPAKTPASPARAKAAPPKLTAPPTWRVRSDATGGPDETVYFVSMPPGWHITTGPGVTLHDPGTRATGAFGVQSTIFLFPAETAAAAASESGYGLLVGGHDLDAAPRRYTAFLLRRDGQFAVVSQRGDARAFIVPWTPHGAIIPHTEPKASAEPVKNLLSLEVSAEQILFRANGKELTTVQRADLDLDGIVGLRVDRGLNLHVSTLQVEAPPASGTAPPDAAGPEANRDERPQP